MRGYYLNPTGSNEGGCRGGIGGGKYDEGYEVEIGNRCYCSSNMMALMVHFDEIAEFLRLSKSPIAKMLLDSMSRTKGEVENKLEQKQNEANNS